jgi:hypothetical protein
MRSDLFLDDQQARPVLDLVRQRGFEVSQHGLRDFLFLPRAPDPERIAEFYSLMKRYSFRLTLRDVIRYQDDLASSRLTRFVDARTAASYLNALARLGMAEERGGRWRLPGGRVENFGPTLEWFVSRVLTEEFAIPALHGVRLLSTDRGGDYDVIGAMSGKLVYVETKSSPPKHIEDREVEVFLLRLLDLNPDLAIFLVDTNLRMLDKVVKMFEKALRSRAVTGARRARSTARRTPVRLAAEIFHLGEAIWLTNSKHELVSNLRACLRGYHSARFARMTGLGASRP